MPMTMVRGSLKLQDDRTRLRKRRLLSIFRYMCTTARGARTDGPGDQLVDNSVGEMQKRKNSGLRSAWIIRSACWRRPRLTCSLFLLLMIILKGPYGHWKLSRKVLRLEFVRSGSLTDWSLRDIPASRSLPGRAVTDEPEESSCHQEVSRDWND